MIPSRKDFYKRGLKDGYKKGKEEAIDKAIKRIQKHQRGLRQDFLDEIIDEDVYAYRDDECLWIIELLEILKEKKNAD